MRDHLARAPVIIGVGETIDRVGLPHPRDPARLMADAVSAAEIDAGVRLKDRLVSIDIVQQTSWPYFDPETRLAETLGVTNVRIVNGPIGGESPIRFLHRAALQISAGEKGIFAVCGAEAEASVRHAEKSAQSLDWPARDPGFTAIRAAASQRTVTRELGAEIPTNVYPLYESALRAHRGQSFAEAQAESVALWSGLSAVAETRACAWQTHRHTLGEIAIPSEGNRPIAWPYTKLMVANPIVNQGAAVLVTSRAEALALGIAPERLIYLLAGAAAEEPGDLLLRVAYHRSEAMGQVLSRARSVLREIEREDFDAVELYSCFPCVPKMARRELRLADDAPISVTGGLTFFGAPLNNYMTHAVAAMVQGVRGAHARIGLLYGQGGYVTRHHMLILSSSQPERPIDLGSAEALHAPVFDGAVVERGEGSARLEAATVLFDRTESPVRGICIARLEDGARTIAGVSAGDTATLAALMDKEREPIGRIGRLDNGAGTAARWRFA